MNDPFDASGAFRSVAEGSDLRRLAIRGAAASVSAQGLSVAAQLVSTVMLARLLTPADFGVVAMVTTFSLLVMSFGSSGLSEVVIQRDQINRFQASNLFWFACTVGLILTIVFAMAGSLLARFYGNPLVTRVATVLSVTIFLAAAPVIHLALLRRAMRFTAVSANEVIGRTVNTVVAILLALGGWGYWALVAGIIAQVLSMAVGAWCLCRWIPSLPRYGVGTRGMLTFAANVYGRFSANYLATNLDNLLIGWQLNAAALGVYKKAYDLFALSGSLLTGPLHNVALAALSRLNPEPARFRQHLAKSLGIIAFIGMAVGADLTLVGKYFVRVVLGANWSESGRIFELFGPGIGVMLIYSTVGWIHLSIGKPERWLRWTMVESLAMGLLFVLALPWGTAGIAVAWSVSFWALLIPAFRYAGKPIGFGVAPFVTSVWKYAAASVLAGLATAAIIRDTPLRATPQSAQSALAATIIISALFVTVYLGTVVLLHWGCEPLRELARLLRELTLGRPAKKPAAESV